MTRPTSVVLMALPALLLLAGEARAEDGCTMTVGPRDRIARSGDVVVEAGESAETVIALSGRVVLRRGARVETAVAVGGDVVLENGAKVAGTAASFGAKVRVGEGARVDGSRLELGDRLRVKGDRGTTVDVKLSVDDTSLGNFVLTKLVEQARGCKLVREDGSAVRL